MDQDINQAVEQILSNKRNIDQIEGLTQLDKEKLKKLLIETEGNQQDEQLKEYESYGHEVTKIRLINCEDDLLSQKPWFAPEYTNQVYRQDEKIYGYKDLEINLNFLAGSLITYININYQEKIEKADNIYEMLDKLFLDGYINNRQQFIESINQEQLFKPNGILLGSFQKNGEQYEVFSYYHYSQYLQIFLYDHSIKDFDQYKKRMQVFLLFYIDGASFAENSEFWKYLIVYKVTENTKYEFVGFLSYYIFLQNAERCRYRLSQIIILPPYQRKGIGFELLSQLYQKIQEDKNCFELTVEECSEEFQQLRDYKDIEIIRKNKLFNFTPILSIPELIQEWPKKLTVTKISKQLKIISTQVYRALEIILLYRIDKNNSNLYKEYEKMVIERLRIMNQTELMPFKQKKYPMIIFESFLFFFKFYLIKQDVRQNYNCEELFKPKATQEIKAMLQSSYDILKENYEKLLIKIDKLLQTN